LLEDAPHSPLRARKRPRKPKQATPGRPADPKRKHPRAYPEASNEGSWRWLFTLAALAAKPSLGADSNGEVEGPRAGARLEPQAHTVFLRLRRHYRPSRTPPTIVRSHGGIPNVSSSDTPQKGQKSILRVSHPPRSVSGRLALPRGPWHRGHFSQYRLARTVAPNRKKNTRGSHTMPCRLPKTADAAKPSHAANPTAMSFRLRAARNSRMVT
jgi:hypothetical protein